MMVQTCSIIVTGKVQGVFYRKSTKEKASKLGLTGTVMNRPDGSVSIIATGTPEQLKQLEDWCRQGPANAVVDSIERMELPLKVFEDFQVIRG